MSFERITPEDYFASKEDASDGTWVRKFVAGDSPQISFSILDDKILILALTAMALAFMAFLVYMKGGKVV